MSSTIQDVIVPIDDLRARGAECEGFSRLALHHTLGVTFAEVQEDDERYLTVKAGEGSDPVRVTRPMFEAIAKDVGAGKNFFLNTPAALLIPTLNYWYGSATVDKAPTSMLLREIDGVSYGEDLIRSSNIPLSPSGVIDLVDMKFRQVSAAAPSYRLGWQTGNQVFTFAAVTEGSGTYSHEVSRRVGDLLNSGILVQFSPTGRGVPTVATYVERLVCLNGMTMTDHVDSWAFSDFNSEEHVGAEEAIYEWLDETIPLAFERCPSHFEAADRMAATPVPNEDIAVTVGDLFDHMSLPAGLSGRVVRHLADVNIESMWDVMNAFTFVGTHDDSIADHRNRLRLMMAGGDVPHHAERCNECRHLL